MTKNFAAFQSVKYIQDLFYYLEFSLLCWSSNIANLAAFSFETGSTVFHPYFFHIDNFTMQLYSLVRKEIDMS